ncbi:MAG: FAD-dependent oxidoreductase [Thermoleophilia bacterium]|nr:FAD-dependent oxidoreductase [Thermoleophilia bacterium]
MSERSDVVVVGGGVIGACVAQALAARGAAVTLLERESEVCPAASAVYANCGLLVPSEIEPLAHPGALGQGLRWLLDGSSPFYVKPRASLELVRWLWLFRGACAPEVARRHAPLLHELSEISAALHDELAAGSGAASGGGGGDRREDNSADRAGRDPDDGRRDGAGSCAETGSAAWHYHRNGWLFVYETAAGMAAAEAAAAETRALGIAVEVLAADEVRERAPQVRPGSVVGGVLTPDDGHMDPGAFTRAMVARARRAGATVVTGAEVYGFETGGGRTAGARRGRASGTHVRAVRTTSGVFAAGEVVLAAGAWTPLLLRELGLRLPVEPAKGYSIDVARPEGTAELPLCAGEAHVVLTPLGDALRLGSTLELAGWDLRLRPRRLAALRRAAARIVGLPEDGPVRQIWRGPRPLTPDGLPVIGRTPRHPNVVLATGHCMLGLSLGPVTGRLVAELCAGEAPSLDIAALAPTRFGR